MPCMPSSSYWRSLQLPARNEPWRYHWPSPTMVAAVYAEAKCASIRKGRFGQYPALLVRTTLRHLRSRLSWGLDELEAAAGLKPGDGRALVKALRSEGLIEAAGRGAWEVTQAGRTL